MCFLDSIITARMGAALVIYFHSFVRDVRKFASKWAQLHFLLILSSLSILPPHYQFNIPNNLPTYSRKQVHNLQWQHFLIDIQQQQHRLLLQFHIFNTNLVFWRPFFVDNQFNLIWQFLNYEFIQAYKAAQQHYTKRISWFLNHKMQYPFQHSQDYQNPWFWSVRSYPPFSSHIKPPTARYNTSPDLIAEPIVQQNLSTSGRTSSVSDNQQVDFPMLSQDNWIVNLSDQSFTNSQMNMLKLGFNYALQPRSPPFFQCYEAIEKIVSTLSDTVNQNTLRSKLTNTLKSYKPNKHNQLSTHAHQFFSTIKKQGKVVLLKSDKGNATVIMNKLEYNSKMTDYLNTPGLFQQLKSDPSAKIISEVNQYLNTIKTQKQIDQKFYNNTLARKTSSHPNLFAQVKVHKQHNPLRPIVNGSNNPTTNLAKTLIDVLKPLKQFCTQAVQDSYAAKELISSLTIQANSKLATIDVVNMYNSLPHDFIIQALQYFFSKYSQELSLNPDVIINLVKLVIYNSYCVFDKKFYKQLHGLPMGGCLSPLLAELTMSYFEVTYLSFSNSGLKFWMRYVDDAFIVFNGTTRQLDNFVNRLNRINHSIKFTSQHEVNGQINYLDLTIHKTDGTLQTSLFFKHTFTGRYLDFSSQHHSSTKKGIAIGLFRRAYKLTTHGESLQPTLNYIAHVLKLNQYPDRLINSALHLANTEPTKHDNKQSWYSLPYIKNISERISQVLKPFNLNLAFKPINTIASVYFSTQPPKDIFLTKACIYAVPCSCGEWYIGETGRTVKQRISEHKYFTKPQHAGDPDLKYKSAIAKHFHATNHDIQWDKTRIVTVETQAYIRKLKEAFFIKKFKPSLNVSEGVDIRPQWFFLLSKQYNLDQFSWLQTKQ